MTKPNPKLSYEGAANALPAAKSAKDNAALTFASAYDAMLAAYATMLSTKDALSESGLTVDKLQAIVDRGPTGTSVVKQREVDNPLRTPATYHDALAQAQAREETEAATRREAMKIPVKGAKLRAAYRQHRPDAQPGKIKASINMVTLIGGLARVSGCTEAMIKGAMEYRSIYEKSRFGGSRAIDYSAVKVDTSGPSETAIWEIGEQARRDYQALVRAVGLTASSVLEQVVCHDMSVRELAIARGLGESGTARATITEEVKRAVDLAAKHLHLAGTTSGSARPREWDDGTTEKMVFTGEVRNPVRSPKQPA